MYEQDVLKRQAEEFTRALARLIAKQIGLKTEGREAQALDFTTKVLKEDLDIDLPVLLEIPPNALPAILSADRRFQFGNLDQMGDILFFMAENSAQSVFADFSPAELYSRALALYQFVHERDITYSFARQEKIDRLLRLLETQE